MKFSLCSTFFYFVYYPVTTITCSALLPFDLEVYVGLIDCVQLFTHKGADVNVSAGGRVTSLHVAADRGDECMVGCLLAIGTSPNAMDDVNSLICHSSILMDTYVYMAVDQAIVTSKYQKVCCCISLYAKLILLAWGVM
jgi:ankyrin repeat protein